MYNVTKEELKALERGFYAYGLSGGGSVVPVELEDGRQVKKDFHNLFDNHNVVIRFYYERNIKGVWCDLVRIQIENFDTDTICTFNYKGVQA